MRVRFQALENLRWVAGALLTSCCLPLAGAERPHDASPAPAAASASLAQVLQASVDKHLIPGAVVFVADQDKMLDLESGMVRRNSTAPS